MIKRIKKELKKIKKLDKQIEYLENFLKKTKNKELIKKIKKLLKEIKESLEAKIESPERTQPKLPASPKFKESFTKSTFEPTKYETRKSPIKTTQSISPLEQSLEGVQAKPTRNQYGPTNNYLQKRESSENYTPSRQIEEVPTIVSRVRESLINKGALSKDTPWSSISKSRHEVENTIRQYAPTMGEDDIKRYADEIINPLRQKDNDQNYEKQGVLQ